MKKLLLSMSLLFCSTQLYAMGTLYVSPKFVKNNQVYLNVQTDCTNCWWNETAFVKGSANLLGKDEQVININTSMPVQRGIYNNGDVLILTLPKNANYKYLLLNLTISGANTNSVNVNKTYKLKEDSFINKILAY